MNPVDRTHNTNSGIVKFAIIDSIGTLMLGLGLFAKFGTNAEELHPLLNDSTVVVGLLIVGSVLMAWGGLNLLSVLKQKSKLRRRA